ncbi:MAG: hypothetical protein ACYDBQ_03125 [Thermoplasmatota archaeon]
MAESVECSECGNRYDSAVSAFCPRCGSTKVGKPLPGAIPTGQRTDPRRRRVQMAGVMLMMIGLVSAAPSLYGIVYPPALPAGFYENLATVFSAGAGLGGALHLTLMDNGTVVKNATLHVSRYFGGNASVTRVGSDGHAFVTLPGEYSNVTVVSGNHTWYLRVLSLPAHPVTTTFEVAPSTAGNVQWVSWSAGRDGRILSAVAGVLLLFVALAGLAAVRLKGYGLALAGALFIFILWLLGTLIFLDVWLGLMTLVVGYLVLLLVRGRSYFARRKKG